MRAQIRATFFFAGPFKPRVDLDKFDFADLLRDNFSTPVTRIVRQNARRIIIRTHSVALNGAAAEVWMVDTVT